MKKFLASLVLLWMIFVYPACNGKFENLTDDLRCEYIKNPMGVEKQHPRLSWKYKSSDQGARQMAYRILAATDEKLLLNDNGDLWDTGKIQSDQSIQIAYQGTKLSSRQMVYWKVRVWNENDQKGAWSEIAFFEMGLLQQDDWQALWIGAPAETDSSDSSPLFRREFDITKPIHKARAYVCGLGYYELYLNGKKVGDHVLSPNQTNYDRRRNENWTESRIGNMSTRVLYEIHDITNITLGREGVIRRGCLEDEVEIRGNNLEILREITFPGGIVVTDYTAQEDNRVRFIIPEEARRGVGDLSICIDPGVAECLRFNAFEFCFSDIATSSLS